MLQPPRPCQTYPKHVLLFNPSAHTIVTPKPIPEHELEQQWNSQANASRWLWLSHGEQLAWAQTQAVAADRAQRGDAPAPLEPRGCPTPGACSCPTAPIVPPELIRALELAEAGLSDIGDSDRELGDDLAWTEARAAQDLPRIRQALNLWRNQASPFCRPIALVDALQRLRRWGGLVGSTGYSADVVLGVVAWIDGGMSGALPPLPDYILSRATTTPKVQTPTDADLYNLAAEYSGDPVPAMRSALALWGRTAVAQPEPEELPDDKFLALAKSHDVIYTKRDGTMASPFQEDTDIGSEVLSFARSAIADDRARSGRSAVAPVAASERPWDREGWCDAEGRCWVGEPERDYPLGETGDFDIWPAEWKLTDPRSFFGAARPVALLPHWAISLPTTTTQGSQP